ncbi:hypothetical protein CRG98_012796 [Punica granatum]|uniref:Uncharacterized protein n=1 Tax=Punica granatum TaxID=22663 RepID=A0A2I0KEU6_PUNGR|nr:hypothetical protein CRG98_012796 [Punica granatum]
MKYGRETGSNEKIGKSNQKGKHTTNLRATGAGIAALFIVESPNHRKGPPEGRSSGSERPPVNLRGTFTENKDHNDPRTPRDIQETPRKPRSQVPRSSRANGFRPGTTSQRSPTRQKGSPERMLRCTKSNRGPGAFNSTSNVRTGQNRLSRRRVARTFVHATYGDSRLIQTPFLQSFQIY